jgi:putative ABC transport system permease protein
VKRRGFRWPWRTRASIRDEVAEEVHFHLEMRTAELVAAGMGEREARERAEREFGDVDGAMLRMGRMEGRTERGRRVASALTACRQDVAFALRTLHRSRGFAAVAILTMALGVGATTAIFSVVNAVLLRPLPYAQPDRLVAVWSGMLPGEYVIAKEEARSFAALAAYQPDVGFGLSGEGEAERISGARVSANFFSTLGAGAVLGRTTAAGEDAPGGDRVVVLGYGLWRSRFGGDTGVVGRTVLVEGVAREVIGVMPRDFRFPDAETQLWVPLSLDTSPDALARLWGSGSLRVVGRLREGASPSSATGEMRALADRLRLANPLWTPPAGYRSDAEVTALSEVTVGDSRTLLLTLLGAVVLVLLIACVNVSNLLLARGAARARELSVRTALGAGRGRVVRQLMTESVVLAGVGGALGLATSLLILRVLVRLLPPETPRLAEVGVDLRVLAFAASISLACGLVVGAAPALRLSGDRLMRGLREGHGAGGDASASRRRLSGTLVVAEVALAVVLVVGAGLLLRSLWELGRVEPGFRSERLVGALVTPPPASYPEAGDQMHFHERLAERIGALPGVTRVAAASRLPFDRTDNHTAFFIEGVTEDPNLLPVMQLRSVTDEYLALLGIPLLEGRALDPADRADAPAVALVDATAARTHWGEESPVGRCIRYPWRGAGCITVVGVVGTVHDNDLAAPPEPAVYVPLPQRPRASLAYVVETSLPVDGIARALRGAVREIDPTVPVSEVRSLERMVAGSMHERRMAALLLGLFATLALVLGAVGIYGVVAYGVQQRRRELGVRMALGASRSDVFHLILGEAGALAVVGSIVGIGAALLTTRVLEGMLFGVGRADPLVLIAVPLLLFSVAMVAGYLPARRATGVDPITTLRGD